MLPPPMWWRNTSSTFPKLADGYSEEEIAARLGDPVALAAQLGEAEAGEKRHSAVLT